jgi:hypothetical protein
MKRVMGIVVLPVINPLSKTKSYNVLDKVHLFLFDVPYMICFIIDDALITIFIF